MPSAFEHGPTLTVVASPTANAGVIWSAANNLGQSTVLLGTGTIGVSGDADLLTLTANNLVLAGQIKITGGSPGADKVLTSNGAGLATWEAAASGGVDTTGTPANDQIAVFTDVDTIEGNNNVKVVDGYIFTLASTMRINSGFAKIEMVTDGSPTADEWRVGADRSANAFLIENAPHTTGTPSFSTWFSLANTGDLTVKENASMPSVTKGIAKCWVRVDSSDAIEGGSSYNVDSLTGSSTNGQYDVNFTADFENNDYVAAGVCGQDYSNLTIGSTSGQATGSCTVVFRRRSDGAISGLASQIVFFGEAT